MTKTEFLKEAENSNLCPDNFSEMLDLQEKFQLIAVSILKEFHKVCVKNGIEYQLAFGSLLGAVRDNGMIPWDYDVDVFVRAEDRVALLEALEKDLREPYYYDSLENNPKRQGVLTRIGVKPYSTLHLHVDVFYLAGVPDDEKISAKHCFKLRRASATVSAKNTPLFEINPFISPKGWLQIAVGKLLFLFKDKDRAFDRYLDLCLKYDSRKSKKLINANSYGGTYYMTANLFEPIIPFETAAGVFMVPKQYDALLKELFGEYDNYPSLKSRIRDTKEHYREFLKLSGEEENA